MSERITIRLKADIVEALRSVVVDEPIDCRSRQDVFRYIVRDWLTENQYLESEVPKRDAG